MTDDALTLAVLTEIRDAVLSTRADLSARLDETNHRLDETNHRLGHLETTMVELAQQQAFVVRWLKAGSRRDRRIEQDLVKLTERVDALESRVPAGK